MARNRVIYSAAALLCLVFSMAYKEKITAVIFIAMLLYPLLAAGAAAFQLLFLKAEFSEKYYSAEKHTRFELVINVANKFIFPCVPVELTCMLPDEETGLVCEKRIFVTLPPFGKANLSMSCMNKYRGSYVFSIKKISAIDPLRIIRVPKKGSSDVTAVFLPRKLAMPGIEDLCGNEPSAARRRMKTEEKDDFSHVRNYYEGEGIQLVHWKLTAKQDELMIKQFDSINDRRARILCDFGGCKSERDVLLCSDTVIETAIAFVREFLDDNICAIVDFGQTDRREACRVSNRTEFESFFELMSVISPDIDVCEFTSLIQSSGTGESVLVLITPEMSEELVHRANACASSAAVFVVYINIFGRIPDRDFFGERFYFMNIQDAGADALGYAVEKMRDSIG